MKKISIIVPFYNEEESIKSVLEEIRATNPEAEIIAVNDGSTDSTKAMILRHKNVRLVSFAEHHGQSAALYAGLELARGEVCVMMDGDGQSDPADIPMLIVLLDRADLVCGYRLNRQDTRSRRLASKTANFIRRMVLRDPVRDTGCSLKAMRKADLRHIIPFDGLHRYIPVFFHHAGLQILEVPINHRPRRAGKSKYAIGRRAIIGLYDLFGVRWLMFRRNSWPKGNVVCAESVPDRSVEVPLSIELPELDPEL
jgi:dolichol-phosphate mannosyltransferase